MKPMLYNGRVAVLGLLAGGLMLASCNKELPKPEPILPPVPSGQTIAEIVNTNPNFTILRAAVTRAGAALTALLSDRNASYTVFAPDDAAFQASGIPSVAAINTFRPGQLDTIVRYHLIGGERYTAARISDKFPNMYLQSMFVLQAPSAAVPPGYRMPLNISRRGTNAWANQIPVKAADIAAANGVIHTIAAVLMPPGQVIAQIASADTTLSFLMAALSRADAGPPPGAPQLIPILSNASANLTVFAPTNNAFRSLLTAQGLPPVVGSIALLPTQTVWGIVAFHVLGSRAFSVNLPSGNNSVPSIMGVAQQHLVGASGVQVRGPGNVVPTPTGPVPFFANVTQANINGINGVVHKIDQVMLPQ